MSHASANLNSGELRSVPTERHHVRLLSQFLPAKHQHLMSITPSANMTTCGSR